jgi:hypothetical protein
MSRRVTLATFSVALFLAACSSGVAATTDRVDLDEFSIGTNSSRWAAGPVTLTVENVGERTHTLIITEADGTVVAATDILDPGQAADLEVQLEPGEYELTCRIVVEGGEGQIFDHYEQGMHTSINVEA